MPTSEAPPPDANARPPVDISPGDFFERWLPAAFAAAGRRPPAGVPSVRVSLSGPDGGGWDLEVDDEELSVTPAGREAPDIWIRLSVADFHVALGAPDPDLPTLLPERWSPQSILLAQPSDADLVRQLSGRILFEIEGKRRRRFALDVGFGKAGVSAGRPRTTVRLDGTTFEGIRGGTIPPMQPLLDGRLKLEGDRALAMQLLLLVGSWLGRR
jgi:SCP-2 sterol transfer family